MPKLTAIRKRAIDGMMKESLFDASIAVLAEYGVEGMTMDRVAAAAGVAKGSLYHYFGSKQDLVQFVYTKIVDPVIRDMTETLTRSGSAVEKLRSHLRRILEHVAQHVQVFKLLFNDDAGRRLIESSERTMHELGCQQMAELFRQGIAEGAFVPADPLILARMFLGLCRGTLDEDPDIAEPEQRERLLCLIMSVFLNGIATEKGRA
ncbi:MAG: TetR/AcrR family transcriptional regulator [Planctomycetaceae bacterium]|nr:TetR/AcrR family transcriptional regulator [Planctomycetaceae bacterium]